MRRFTILMAIIGLMAGCATKDPDLVRAERKAKLKISRAEDTGGESNGESEALSYYWMALHELEEFPETPLYLETRIKIKAIETRMTTAHDAKVKAIEEENAMYKAEQEAEIAAEQAAKHEKGQVKPD